MATEKKSPELEAAEISHLEALSVQAKANATKKLTKASIKRRWNRKDWWISSDEALEYGLIDEVR